MNTTALGAWLRHLRELKGLSLRHLGDRADLDHAYIYRMERGDKGAPSAEVIARLAQALELGTREREILEYVADRPDTDLRFVDLIIEDETISADEFFAAAGTVYRGRTRPDPKTMIERARRLLKEDSDDG